MVVPSHPHRWIRLALLVLPALLSAVSAESQQRRSPRPPRPPGIEFFAPIDVPRRAPRPATAVTESEPNNSDAEAMLLSLGDSVSGIIFPQWDQDWYAVDLTAGTTVELDLDAVEFGSGLIPLVWVFVRDETNELVERPFNARGEGGDPIYWLTIPEAGRYFVMIEDWLGGEGSAFFYTLKIRSIPTPPPGPGEPMTLFADGVSAPLGMAAAGNGDLYVADAGLSSILRVDPAGTVSTFAAGVSTPFDIAIDGFGDFLVATFRSGVLRITPSGERRVFAPDFTAVSVAVDRAGDVWVGGAGTSSLQVRRYSPTGTLLSAIPVFATEGGGMTASTLAISPAGHVYVTNGYNGIYRVTGGPVLRVVTTPVYCLSDLAFDVDGYLYVTSCAGQMMLYDPAFQEVSVPFAYTNGGPMAFGRDAAGGMTSRLFKGDGSGSAIYPPFDGGILEVNPAAVRAPGLRIGVDMFRLATTTIRGGFAGVPYADTLRAPAAPGAPTWSVTEGALPPGVTLDPSSGILSGKPGQVGNFSFRAMAASGELFGAEHFVLSVEPIPVTVANAAAALLGATGSVSPQAEHLLDLMGNGNGRLDVADFRAYLQSLGRLAPPSGGARP